MRVAMVSEHANPLAAVGGVDAGGQNVHVAALSTALAGRGAEVIVYTRRDGPGLPRRAILAEGVTVEHVDAGPPRPIPKDDLLGFMPELAQGLHRSWLRHPPDVVHAHFWMSGLASLEAAWPLEIPVVQTFHALGSVKRRYQGAKDGSPPERIPAEVALAARADWIIATCTDEVRELEALGADTRRITVVPCGVDTSLFTPAGPVAPRLPGVARIAAVGRLVERKGVDDIIRVLEAVPGAELVVAGGPAAANLSEDADASRLRRVADSCGVANRVRLLGRVERAALPALLRSADVVACTPWYEPFGIVPLEAMACEVPVVASRIGGLIDTIRDGVTGMHVPPRDPDALAVVLRGLLADRNRRGRLGRAGRVRAVRRYQWTDVAAATTVAYESALRVRKAPDEVAIR